jgi:hypothetical protein
MAQLEERAAVTKQRHSRMNIAGQSVGECCPKAAKFFDGILTTTTTKKNNKFQQVTMRHTWTLSVCSNKNCFSLKVSEIFWSGLETSILLLLQCIAQFWLCHALRCTCECSLKLLLDCATSSQICHFSSSNQISPKVSKIGSHMAPREPYDNCANIVDFSRRHFTNF